MIKYKNEIDVNCQNVVILADFDNLYYGLSDYGLNLNLDEYNIFHKMNFLYGTNKIRQMVAFANFDQLQNISYKTLKEQRVYLFNVFGSAKKNTSDIELSIHALEIFYRHPEIDTFVFITSDSDMIPIMNKLLMYGKKVHLYYIDSICNEHITNFCNLSINILDLLNINEDKEPNKFLNDALGIIERFNYYNPDKILYHKRFLDNLIQNLYLSPNMGNKVIDLLVTENLIVKIESGYSFGYKINK